MRYGAAVGDKTRDGRTPVAAARPSGEAKSEGSQSERSLPERSHPGDPKPQERDGIRAFYRDHADRLSATLRKIYGDGPPDPDDICQQAFQKLIERGDLGSIVNLKAFVWRTARNLVLKAKRADDVRARYDYEVEQIYFPLKGDDSTPERVIVARDQLKAINALLLAMPEKRRRAVILHRVDGLSVAEVGRRLGISRSTAAQHVARGVADLDILFLSDGER